MYQNGSKRVALLPEFEALGNRLSTHATFRTKKIQQEHREAESNESPQSFVPKLSRGGCMELDISANVQKNFAETRSNQDIIMLGDVEGCAHDTSGSHVHVPLFAESLSPEKLNDAMAQQGVQMPMQDNIFSVFSGEKLDSIIHQNGKQEQPNFSILRSRFGEAPTSTTLGQIKHFYLRRHKRHKQCFAPSEVSMHMSEQELCVSSKTPDGVSSREMADLNDICPDTAPSEFSLQIIEQSVASRKTDEMSPREQVKDRDICPDNAPLEVSLQMSELELISARKTPDEMPSRELADDKDMCPDSAPSEVNLQMSEQKLFVTSKTTDELSSTEWSNDKDVFPNDASSEGCLQMNERKHFIASKTSDEMPPREQANDNHMCLDNAPSVASLHSSEQKPSVASKTPDEIPSREQADDKCVCLDNASPEVSLQMSDQNPFVELAFREHGNDEDTHLNNVSSSVEGEDSSLENKNPSTPSLDLSKSDLLQSKQARKAARWERELMQLVGNGHALNEDSTRRDKELAESSRKRRRLQNNGSENLGVKEQTATQNTTMLVKGAQQKWRDVELRSTDATELIGCKCKVFWPDDKAWYPAVISGYNSAAGIHHVRYDDGDKEELILAKELIKFSLSDDDVIKRKLLLKSGTDKQKELGFQEMAALATVFEDFQEEFQHGELVWAKIKGHPMWPAFVIDEKHVDAWGLDAPVRENTLAVQFFGSYDYARINLKQVVAFSKGLLLKLYRKCKKATFDRGLEEAERYLKEGKLPDIMSKLQDDALDSSLNPSQIDIKEEDQDFMGDERTHKTKKSIQSLYTCPIKLGDLQVLSLGKIVRDSEFFHTENQIWTEGYTAVRKFPSIKDPRKSVDYTMEITKDPHNRIKPLFCVTSADGEVVEGSSPSTCWNKIYQKLDKAKEKSGALSAQKQATPGGSMFGFTHPQILKLIQALPYARVCFKFTGWFDKRGIENMEQLLPAGFMPVEVDWKNADRCSVCDLDEDYTNNLFLQCDRCRILVHMHCYGVSEPPNGHLWLCQLCKQGISPQNALCCLCPVQGGAMKRTTDGRWAHLTCAMWIPETCFVDVKHVEPIDGLKSINKERWKLTCSICKVPYGVCIQCSDPSCYVAYHVLCARSSGCVLEVSEDLSHRSRNVVEDLDDSVLFLSYCKKHQQSKVEKGTLVLQQAVPSKQDFGYYPRINSSGCARTEPYNGATRRGRQEPEVRAAASAKRVYVEKIPYLVGGFCKPDQCGSIIANKFGIFTSQARNMQFRNSSLSSSDSKTMMSKGVKEANIVVAEDFSNIFSVADRYKHMCESLKHRVTFGKSAIHGWGVFTKRSHRAGDMVIEYAGEVVRPIVADLRERSIYNTLVGAGTYMFRIDDEHVVDATREGSIAHLINHSCEPNCFSRVVTICDEEHIIIFAKQDIETGEELSYDYRFTSKGELLECFCGAPSCRGFVNVNDEEETSRILVPCHEIRAWTQSAS